MTGFYMKCSTRLKWAKSYCSNQKTTLDKTALPNEDNKRSSNTSRRNQIPERLFRKICNALRDLASFVQFKKREKHLWRNPATLVKNNSPSLVFFTFFKLYQWSQIAQSVSYINTTSSPFYQGSHLIGGP